MILALLAFVLIFSLPAFATFNIAVQSPTNSTYTTTFSNPLNISVNFTFGGTETVSPPCNYTLDDGSPVILSNCQNFTRLFEVGLHSLMINANSTLGTANSTTRNFTVYSNFTFFNQSINTIIENVYVPAQEDTWVSDGTGCNATVALSGSAPAGTGGNWTGTNSTINHGNDSYLLLDAQNQPYIPCTINNIVALWKMNMTNATTNAPYPSVVQNKIIYNMTFIPPSVGGCSSVINKTLYYCITGSNWNESNVTYNDYNSYCGLTQAGTASKFSAAISTWRAENLVNTGEPSYFLSRPDLIQKFYNDAFVTLATNQNTFNGTNCNQLLGWSSMHYVASKEAPTPAYANLIFTLVDYISTGNDYPLFSAAFPYFYYDFETGSINANGAQSQIPLSSSFAQADFKWNLNNILIPQNGATAVIVAIQNDTTNTLANVACAGQIGYSAAPITGLNSPSGNYFVICFNLTATHNGRPFFGAIKVTNARTDQILGIPTGGDFAFYAALYSPAFTGFSQHTKTPASPQAGQNVTYTWTTSQPLTTGIQYFIQTGGSSNAITLVSNDSLTTFHTFTITGSQVVPESIFTVRVFGVANDSTTFWSPYIDTFTVAGIGGISGNLVDIIEPANGGSGGLGVFLFNELGFPTSGSVSLDGGNFYHTSPVICNNCSFLVQLSDNVNYTVNKPIVYVTQFPPDLSGIGTHTIRAKDDSGYRTRNFTIDITFLPFPQPLRVLPNTCIPYAFHDDQTFCHDEIITLNLSSFPSPQPTGAFCQWNPTECQIFNTTNGQCIQQARHLSSTGSGRTIGGWIFYVCYNNFYDNYYGKDILNGTALTGGTSPSDQTGDWLSLVFGVDVATAKAVFAMIITLILTILVGIKTKDGLTTAIIFLGGMGVFLL